MFAKILTKDSVTVFVNAIMYYKVKDPISAVTNVDDYSGSARLLAATTLRNVLGTRNLGDILSERESIAQEMQVTNSYFEGKCTKRKHINFCGTSSSFTRNHFEVMIQQIFLSHWGRDAECRVLDIENILINCSWNWWCSNNSIIPLINTG